MNRDAAEAIRQFAEATRLDPDYAQAWLWLGFIRAISARSRLQGEAVRTDCAQARKEIETATRLAPDYGLGYSALAVQLMSCDYDWNGASAQFRKAMPLVSDTSPAHGQYSRLLATLGRVNQAIEERRKFLVGDPLNAEGYYRLSELEASLGRLDDAEAGLRKAMELEPDDASWYAEDLSSLAILRGDAGAALAEAKRAPPGRARDRALALALQIGNDRAAAEAALQRLAENEGEAKYGAFYIARAYALRGDADGMFEWLNRDWERRELGAYQALYDPLLLRFRDDPRFAAYCKRTGLPPPSESEALSIDRIRALPAAKR
jgi:tetratricopeptide (TPR) repeat protein